MENRVMRKFLLLVSLVCLCFFFSKINAEASGFFYTNATYPITATGTNNKDVKELKKGSASTINILYCVELGDASINKAIKNAGITKISHIDVNEKSVFFFWRKVTVNVYGE